MNGLLDKTDMDDKTNCLIFQTSGRRLPEKEYACHILFHELLGLAYRIEPKDVQTHTLRLPNGAELTFQDHFLDADQAFTAQMSAQFAQSMVDTNVWPPDPFAATFFLLTRMEERSPLVTKDKHGRFPASSALAYKGGFLNRPVVNEWADKLWTALTGAGWSGMRKRRTFQISISCDVDHPLLWWTPSARAKTLAGALFKRGNLPEAFYWLKNHLFKQKDPYDVFDEWLRLFEQKGLRVQFNFMGERPVSSDCWYPLRHPFVGRLMDKIAQNGHQIGFHPSYEAFENENAFFQELASLRAVSPLEINAGRQHYLRFATPRTWRMWEAAGLKEDSTLGYPEAEGFRGGICQDYPVFDLEQRKMLQLREKPLVAMDVTLAQYRAYSPLQGAEHLWALRKEVEKHGGDFTLLWHNSSWNTPFWEPWKGVFLDILAP